MITVLITQGKGNSRPDYAKVRQFEETFQAEEFCKKVADHESKYWTKAEIIAEFETVELCPPEGY